MIFLISSVLDINKDFLKQVHRKMNAKNCTFRPLLVVILNSKQHVNLDTKDLSKYFKILKRCTTKLSKIGLFNL